MPLRKLAASHAHQLLAELIEAGLLPPTDHAVGVARNEEHGVQVVITITPYQGPMRIAPAVVEQIKAIGREPRLTPGQQQLVALLDQTTPRKATWIAAKLKKRSTSGSFYGMLSELERLGVIRRVDGGGYVRT